MVLVIIEQQVRLMMKNSVSINDYQYADHLIAANRDAKVYKAVNALNPDLPPLIFKGYPEEYLNNPHKEQKLIQELNILWKFRDKPNIIQIISQHYRDRMIFIITEYCEGGDLGAQVKEQGPFKQEKAVGFIKQIINGYSYIHEAKMIHRNIQPSSILISDELEVKISNFSQVIYMKDAIMTMKRQQIVGVLPFQAPEVLQKYQYGTKADIYSIGLLFLFMLQGKNPFTGANKFEILKHIQSANLEDIIGNQLTNTSKTFLLKTLKANPEDRMDIEQLVNYSFDLVPALPLNKFVTFQDADSRSKDSSSKQLESIQEEFGAASPIIIPFKKPSHPDLKASEQFESSVLHKDKEVSIFIPSKLHPPISSKIQSKKEFFKMFEAQSNICLEYQPSLLVLPAEKDGSVRSLSHRSRRSSIDITIKSNSGSKNSGGYNIPQLLKKKTSIKIKTNDHSTVQNTRSKIITSRKDESKLLSPRNQDPIIEIHSPRKFSHRPLSSQRSEIEPNHEEEIIANWLLSQVDLIRYLTRTSYRLSKLENPEYSAIISGLYGFRRKVLNHLSSLEKLDSTEISLFRGSPSHLQLQQIIKIYEERCQERGKEMFEQDLQRILQSKIIELFERVTKGSRADAKEIRVLDHMVYCWKLIDLYKSQTLREFYDKSSLDELIQAPEKEANISRLLDIHIRLKIFRMIQE